MVYLSAFKEDMVKAEQTPADHRVLMYKKLYLILWVGDLSFCSLLLKCVHGSLNDLLSCRSVLVRLHAGRRVGYTTRQLQSQLQLRLPASVASDVPSSFGITYSIFGVPLKAGVHVLRLWHLFSIIDA